jgi:hypothetical protein
MDLFSIVRISDQITQTFVEENRRSFVNQSRAPTDVLHFILAARGFGVMTVESVSLPVPGHTSNHSLPGACRACTAGCSLLGFPVDKT